MLLWIDQMAQSALTGHEMEGVVSDDNNSEAAPDQSNVYEIRIKGHLGREWTDWFDGLVIELEDNGDTLLTGALVDQAALHGLLRRVRDLGIPLVSVTSKSTFA